MFGKVYQMKYLAGILAGDALAAPPTSPMATPRANGKCVAYIAPFPNPEGQRHINVGVGPRNHVHTDELTHAFSRTCTSIRRRLNRCDITPNDHRGVATADLFVADQFNLRSFYHCIGRFNDSHKSSRLNHAQGVCHRDLKSPNVLYDRDLNIKLCDFAFSKFKEGISVADMKSRVGTPAWMAPEVLCGMSANSTVAAPHL